MNTTPPARYGHKLARIDLRGPASVRQKLNDLAATTDLSLSKPNRADLTATDHPRQGTCTAGAMSCNSR
jgi:hypothetical protein